VGEDSGCRRTRRFSVSRFETFVCVGRVRAGVPLNAISKLLGHASVLTSSRYAHIPSEVVEASAALVGDRIAAMTAGGGICVW